MTAFEYINSKLFVKLKPSRIDGIGVFAIKDIPANTSIFDYWEGETGSFKISQEEFQLFSKEIQKHILDLFIYNENWPKDSNIYVNLTNGQHWIYTTPYYFVNSSNNPNIDKNSKKTLRNINQGEEILSSYKRYDKIKVKNLI